MDVDRETSDVNRETADVDREDAAGDRAVTFDIHKAPAALLDWIKDHPGQTALLVVNGVIVCSPAALTAPLLYTMGFGAQGPLAGSVAASLQGMLGNVGAGSLFAYLQSTAMGGYGVAVVNGIVRGAAGAVVAATGWLWRRA